MVVLVLTACPNGLRGYVTRWLLEISPGVFTGQVGHRVRDLLWEKTVSLLKDGRAIMVFSARNEQHLEFRVHRHDWVPTDFDGVNLMMRPSPLDSSQGTAAAPAPNVGWSDQSKWRRARQKKARTDAG